MAFVILFDQGEYRLSLLFMQIFCQNFFVTLSSLWMEHRLKESTMQPNIIFQKSARYKITMQSKKEW